MTVGDLVNAVTLYSYSTVPNNNRSTYMYGRQQRAFQAQRPRGTTLRRTLQLQKAKTSRLSLSLSRTDYTKATRLPTILA